MTPSPVAPASSITAERILVVAPHPDDEALGCGGLIHNLAGLGRAFHVVFVTDGGASHLNSSHWPRERLAAEREKEAAAALRHLGIADAPRSFMRLPDARMPKNETAAFNEALVDAAGIAGSFRPDLALLPWRRDPHRDHRDSWTLFTKAFEAAAVRPDILEYAIWLDEIGAPGDHPRSGEMERLAFDVAGDVSAKKAAVDAHRTQTTTLIDDDPDAFLLTTSTISRLVGPIETYWRQLS